MEIIHAMCKKFSLGFALFSAELAPKQIVNGILMRRRSDCWWTVV
jgi:hypothetical protein